MTSAILDPAFVGSGRSTEFFDFLKALNNATGKEEEAQSVKAEIFRLKQRLQAPDRVTQAKLAECVVSLLYCEMLGYKVEFGYIHAIILAQSAKTLKEKRIGYLVSSLLLNKDDELSIMLMNSIQQDLKNSNPLVICCALDTLRHLVSSETFPIFSHTLEALLMHPSPFVRKKSVTVLHKVFNLDARLLTTQLDKLQNLLEDGDIGVRETALSFTADVVSKDKQSHHLFGSSILNTLEVIVDTKLGKVHDYHGIAAPWIQIKCLRILGCIGNSDPNLRERILCIVIKTLRKATKGVDAAYAITLEAFKSLTGLQIELPSRYHTFFLHIINRFTESSNNNLKYNGLLLLMNAYYFYQDAIKNYYEFIFDCLESTDDTLKQTAIDLLYKSNDHGNIERITIEMLKHLCSSTDSFRQRQLTKRILEIGEKHGIDKFWYIDTLVAVLQFNAEMERSLSEMVVQMFTKHRLSLETAFISQLLEQLVNVDKQDVVLSSSLVRVIAWIFGEWFLLATDQNSVIHQLFRQLEKSSDSVTQVCIHNALIKILSQIEIAPECFVTELNKLKLATQAPYNWICCELDLLCTKPKVLHRALCSDDNKMNIKQIQIDDHISFLDEFVAEAIANGASSYDSTKCSTWLKRPDAKNNSIKYHAYEQPKFTDLRERDFKYGINSPAPNKFPVASLHDAYESTRVSEDMSEPSILPTIRSYLPSGMSQLLRKDYFALPNRSLSTPEATRKSQQSNRDIGADKSHSLPNAHYNSRQTSSTSAGHQGTYSSYNEGHIYNVELGDMSQSMYAFSRERRLTQERSQDLRASLPNVLETKGGTIIRHDIATNSDITEDQKNLDYNTYQSEGLVVHIRKIHQLDSVIVELILKNTSEGELVKFFLKAEYEPEQLSNQWEILSDTKESEIVNGPEVEIPQINGFETVLLHLKTSISSEVNLTPIPIEFIGTYMELTGTTHVFQTEYELLVTDFIRPLKMTLKEFNSHWTEISAEVKKHISFDRTNTFQEIAQKLSNFNGTGNINRRLHLIEITDERVSVAGQVINGEDLCLIRFQPTTQLPEQLIEMKVRSTRSTLAKLVARDCKPLLS